MAGLKGLSGTPAAPAPVAEPAPADAADPAAPVADPATAEPAKAETTEPAEPAKPADEPAKPADEPAGAAAIRKLEQHTRRQLAEERAKQQAELDTQKTAWSAKLEKAADLERKLAAGREDPVALLKSIGFTDDDLAGAGRLIYGSSTEGAKDPRYKQAGEAALAKTQQLTQVQKLEAKLAAFEEQQTRRDQAAQAQAQIDRFATAMTKAIPPESPIAKGYAKHPDKVRDALLRVGDELYIASGPSNDLRDVPTHAEIFAAYERQRDEALEMYGIDPAILKSPTAKPAIKPAATIAPAGVGAPTAPTASPASPVASPTPAPVPAVRDPKVPMTRDEVLAGLARLKATGIA